MVGVIRERSRCPCSLRPVKMRTMPVLAVFALVGAAMGLWLPVFDSSLSWPFALVLLAPVAWWLFGPGVLLAMLTLTFSSLQCHWYREMLLPQGLGGSDILIRGVVTDLPREAGDSLSFSFTLLPDALLRPFPRQVTLTVYSGEPRPQAGESWQFLARLKQPVAIVNRDGFDREVWNLWNHVNARGYVRTSRLNRRLQQHSSGAGLTSIRDELRKRIVAALEGHSATPLLLGITLAARQSVDAYTWQILRDTGTSHLLAISGLHIGMVAALLWLPGRLAGTFMHQSGKIADPSVPARVFALSGAIAYGALAGYPTPTMRACLMIAMILLLGWRQRSGVACLGVLSCALLLMLLVSPLIILSAGFWLSFLAVGLLYVCLGDVVDGGGGWSRPESSPRAAVSRFIAANMRAQFVLGVGLAVPSLLFFSQLSLVSFIANPLAIPAFSFLILPLSLAGTARVSAGIAGGASLLAAAAACIDWLVATLDLLARIPGATWPSARLEAITLLGLLAGSACMLLRAPRVCRALGFLLVVGLLGRGNPTDNNLLRLQVLDVGQGLSVLVRTRSHSLLYDTGARWQGGDSGQHVILPALRANAIDRLDMLIVSHDDADHSGGLLSILDRVSTKKLLGPEDGYRRIKYASGCRAGLEWQWDEVKFAIVHPEKSYEWSDNNASCVLLIAAGDQKILLPGDIEADAELRLVRDPRLKELSLVIAPHHGSRTSSTEAFVLNSATGYVVFSAGFANRWGFPKPEVVQRWNDSGACALNTATSGSLDFMVGVDGKLKLADAGRASWKRPWVLRDTGAVDCMNTVNSALAGL